MINIILVNPDIPNNTGNIIRTCAVSGAKLHVIEPCGFSWDDKYLKRSGLDYWEFAYCTRYSSMADFLEKNFKENAVIVDNVAESVKLTKEKSKAQFVFASSKAQHNHAEVKYEKDTWIFFGCETKGLDEELLFVNYEDCARIPMLKDRRCLNLANSVCVFLYEALRQNNFEGLEQIGHLTKY